VKRLELDNEGVAELTAVVDVFNGINSLPMRINRPLVAFI
jgi:hypothetical protein